MENRIEGGRIPKTKVQIEQENKDHKISKSAIVSNVRLAEECTKTYKKKRSYYLKVHNIKEKCFNRVHSFTLAGKHQMHLVRELLQRLCLHKEPEMFIFWNILLILCCIMP